MVWIHLLRHGIAIDRDDPDCPDDPERYLTDKGRARTVAATQAFGLLGVAPSMVLASPYVRAQQTADIAVLALVSAPARKTCGSLIPMARPGAIVDELHGHGHDCVLLVGHAPNLDGVIAHLVGSQYPVTSLKKAGLASVEALSFERGAGRLFAVYPPSLLRSLSPSSSSRP